MNGEAEIHPLMSDKLKRCARKTVRPFRADHYPDMLMFDVPPPLRCKIWMARWRRGGRLSHRLKNRLRLIFKMRGSRAVRMLLATAVGGASRRVQSGTIVAVAA